VFRIKYQEAFSYKPNADTSHLLDSLVSALAVYATAFRSKLSLSGGKAYYASSTLCSIFASSN